MAFCQPQEADTLVVLAPRNEVGSATDRIPAALAGTPADVGVNAALLIRGLSTLAAGSDEAVINLRGPTAPIILEPAGETADRHVLAPVRLAEPIAAPSNLFRRYQIIRLPIIQLDNNLVGMLV